MFLSRVFLLLATGGGFALTAPAAPLDDFVKSLYRPWNGEFAALSPDGERLAYTSHERGELVIYLMAVNHPEPKFKIAVADDRAVAFTQEKSPARLRYLAWASPTRLVFAPQPQRNGVRTTAPIFAVNADGTAPTTLAEADDFATPLQGTPMTATSRIPIITRPSHIHGPRLGERTTLLVQALGAESVPTTLFAIDTSTGKKTELTEEIENGRYLYDPRGQVRALYSTPPRSTTRTFRAKINGTWDRWVDMDRAWSDGVLPSFDTTTANYYGPRAYPLGADAHPSLLYYASNVGRDTFGLYAYDTATKQRTPLAVEDPRIDLAFFEPAAPGTPLVIDPVTGLLVGVRVRGVLSSTHWTDPELATLQRDFDARFPQRTVEIMQWDDARRRFLLRVTGGADPGRLHVFQRPENVFVELVRSAPWLRAQTLHRSTSFEFETPAGVRLSGYLTFPRQPRLNPPPLLLDFANGPLSRAYPGFDREAQVFAELGFVVARLNLRGGSGFGLAHRQALRNGGDRVPVEDALAAVEWIARHHAIDRKRVVTYGHDLGGHLALRALQLEPTLFRCGLAVDAPLSPAAWLQPDFEDMGPGASVSPQEISPRPPPSAPVARPIDFFREARRAFFFGETPLLTSVLETSTTLTRPVMLIVNSRDNSVIATQNDTLRSRLTRAGRAPEYLQTTTPEGFYLAGERVKTFRRIEEFLNLNLYDFGVKVGPTKEFLRSLALCVLGTLALRAATAPAPGPVSSPIVELPPMIIAESSKAPPWLYAAAGDTEYLSRCSERTTRAFIAAQLEIHRTLRDLVPAEFLATYTVPTASILVPLSSMPTADDAVFRDILRTEEETVRRASGATPGEAPAPRSRFAFLPNQRLDDRDMRAVFTFLDESSFDPQRLVVAEDYVHAMLTRCTPMLPQWLIEGLTGLYAQTAMRADPPTIHPVAWVTLAETRQLRADPEGRRVLLPLRDLFAPDAILARDHRHPIRAAVWRSQAALFVRWSLDPAHPGAREALWKFVARVSREPVTEQIFTECFGFGYADLLDRLSDYVPVAVSTPVRLTLSPSPAAPRLNVTPATLVQIARLRGEWERLEIPYVRARHPQFLERYIEQARTTFLRATSRGERDPHLLAAAGLCELDAGDTTAARLLLESAVAARVARPRIYFETARLRWDDLTRDVAPTRKFSLTQLQPILAPLREALVHTPPLPEAYLLALDVWQRCEEPPPAAELLRLAESAVLFRRIPSVGFQVARLLAKTGRRAEAVALLTTGLEFLTDPASCTSYRQLLDALTPPAPNPTH
eukprot:gene32662-42302_t